VKLAEALALRADSRRRIDELRARIIDSAIYQEGTEPAEDATALLAEADQLFDQLESLIRRINRTNSATDLGADGTMTDALARRDALRLRHSLLIAAAEVAAGRGNFRQLRSELRYLSALPVAPLRSRADQVAREIRELDGRIQQANWDVELDE
jgi:hypothetical protein